MSADEGRTEDQNTFRADRGSSPGLLRRYFYVSVFFICRCFSSA